MDCKVLKGIKGSRATLFPEEGEILLSSWQSLLHHYLVSIITIELLISA